MHYQIPHPFNSIVNAVSSVEMTGMHPACSAAPFDSDQYHIELPTDHPSSSMLDGLSDTEPNLHPPAQQQLQSKKKWGIDLHTKLLDGSWRGRGGESLVQLSRTRVRLGVKGQAWEKRVARRHPELMWRVPLDSRGREGWRRVRMATTRTKYYCFLESYYIEEKTGRAMSLVFRSIYFCTSRATIPLVWVREINLWMLRRFFLSSLCVSSRLGHSAQIIPKLYIESVDQPLISSQNTRNLGRIRLEHPIDLFPAPKRAGMVALEVQK